MEEADAGKAVAPLAKTVGPLSTSSIGLSVAGSATVAIFNDAAPTLGPVSMSLLGLTFTANLSKVTSLGSLMTVPFEASFTGMDVFFDKPPTRLAGLLLKSDDLAEDGYMGAMSSLWKRGRLLLPACTLRAKGTTAPSLSRR
jgi:hypothetical protein